MRSAPKEDIHAPIIEEEFTEEGTFLAGDFAAKDSLGIRNDSVAVKVPLAVRSDSLKKQGPRFLYNYKIDDQHNMEQVYYNKYFAELLIDRRPPPAVDSTAFNPNLPDSLQTKGKKKGLNSDIPVHHSRMSFE